MKKSLFSYLFVSVLFLTSLLAGGSVALADETDSSKVTYDYVDISTLTDEQKNSITKGTPSEIYANDLENYLFVYQKNASDTSTSTNNDTNSTENNDSTATTNNNPIRTSESPTNVAGESKGNAQLAESKSGNANNSIQASTSSADKSADPYSLLKTGDTGISTYIIILGVLMVVGGITLLSWKKRYSKQILLFIAIIGGSSLLVSSFAQAAENSHLKPQESIISTKGVTETKKPAALTGYTYVGYIHTSENNNTPTPTQEGTVTVNYQDENGSTLAPSETLTGAVGDTFNTTQKDIDGYNYKKVLGNTSGSFTKESQEVTYIYEKQAVSAGTVTVKYVDTAGNIIHAPQTIDGNVGESYDTTTDAYQPKIAGLKLDSTRLPNNATGTLSNQAQEIVYVYRELKDVKITIKFVDKYGNPFVVEDLSTFKNGDFIPLYPNLDKYQVKLDYNQQTYNQNEQVGDIVIQSKEDETYSLPKRVYFNIIDDKGNPVEYLISQDPDDGASGIMFWYNRQNISTNYEGTLSTEDVVVTYQIEGYAIGFPAP